ncbi:esterase/lipase family protein [Streptomyces sp. URMC 123]|uniref:esterase/lipase family protein n=1 Tax=Streptomyces sp. URMC 123 TaxID=3423403 RepID=UPI003F1B342C
MRSLHFPLFPPLAALARIAPLAPLASLAPFALLARSPRLPRFPRIPYAPPSGALVRATVLDLMILAGHVLLYPTGMQQERVVHRTPAPLPAATDRPPVLLLHGFIDNRSVFVLLRRSLLRHGWRHVEALNYSPLLCDVRAAAELLGRHVDRIRARTGHERVDIVGHSLGGLIARYYVQRLGGDQRVRTLVTLGTPHSGTRALPLGSAHPIVRQMRPGSDVIRELALPAPDCTTRFISFWAELDQIMVPAETARVDHPDLLAHNVRVSGIGHLALPVHGAVAAGVRQALEDADAGTGPTATASVA